MNKVFIYASLVLLAFNFTSCRNCEEKYLNKDNPDASFKIYLNNDSTKVFNPQTDTILITDKVTFVSTAGHNVKTGVEEKYVLYTSFGSCQIGPYQETIDTVTTTINHGTAITLAKQSSGDYAYRNYGFKEGGDYKLFYVATLNAKNEGCYERSIDSSITVTVFDPNSVIAKVNSMTIKKSSKKSTNHERSDGGWNSPIFDNKTTATISEADSTIKIGSTNDKQMALLNNTDNFFLIEFGATSKRIWIDGVAMRYNPTMVIKFVNGSKLKIESPNGKKTRTYTISIVQPPKSSAVVITKVVATHYNKDDFFNFTSATATVDTNKKTITLPILPYGTDSLKLQTTITGVTTYLETSITKYPTSIELTAPNGNTKYTYTVLKPELFESATFTNVILQSPKTMAFQYVNNSKCLVYPLVKTGAVTAADTTFKFVFVIEGLGGYSKVTYENQWSTKFSSSAVTHDFKNDGKEEVVWTPAMSDTIPFKIVNGKDVKTLNIIVKAENY